MITRHLVLGCILTAVSLLTSATAQDAGERLELRVISTGVGGSVVVDRGQADGVAVGDAVLFRPRAGGEYRGTVARVEERSAVVQIDDRSFTATPGTRGEVFVPASRRPGVQPARPQPNQPPDQQPTARERADWPNKDEGWTPDKPLLSQVRPVDPKERRARFGGRFFTFAELNHTNIDSFDNSLLRTGVDAWLDNPWQRGGRMRFDGEFDYRTEGDLDGADLTVRELSYEEGGTRFTPTRWQVGRFLQADVPQLGLLDGVAFSERRENGHRYGGSVGFLPELDHDMDTGEDLQFAGFYRWVDDARETLSATAAVQKTFHRGKSDRDLIVLDARRLPTDGWDLRASMWIDLYSSSNRDAVKGQGVEITQAFASAGRRFESGAGFDVAFRRLRFPAQLRNAHGPVIPGEIRNDRYDRLTFTGWSFVSEKKHRAHGQLSLFDDETTDGAALDLGLDVRDALFENGNVDITVFGNAGRVGSHLGARATLGRTTENGRWDALYEISNHHFDGFTADRDDLIQHRVYATRSFDLDSFWHLTAHAGAHLWDKDTALAAGFYLQRSF